MADHDWQEAMAPSLEQIEAIARASFALLPEDFRSRIGDILFRVAEFPEEDVLDDLEIESEFGILGLFQGTGIAHDTAVPHTFQMPNVIWLYRRPILDYWAEHEETLGAIVSHVLVHEIGHHFGLSDDDMETLEDSGDD